MRLFSLISLLLMTNLAWSETPAVIHITAEDRDKATHADGSGLYWDMLRAVFEPQGIEVQPETAPYTRAVGMVRYRQADAVVGVYQREAEEHGLVLPEWHLDSDVISVVFRKGQLQWQGWEALKGLHVGKVRGYRIDGAEDEFLRPHRLRHQQQLLHHLKKGDIDVMINARNSLWSEVEQGQLDPQQWSVFTVDAHPVYIAFADTERGRALAQHFDQGMSRLIGSAQLSELFNHWQWDTFEYDSRHSTLVAKRN